MCTLYRALRIQRINPKPPLHNLPTFFTLVAEKLSTKKALVTDIVSLEENVIALKVDLKVKKAEPKKMDNEFAKLKGRKQRLMLFRLRK